MPLLAIIIIARTTNYYRSKLIEIALLATSTESNFHRIYKRHPLFKLDLFEQISREISSLFDLSKISRRKRATWQLFARSNRKFGRLSRRRFRLKQQEEVPRGDKFPLLAPSTKGFAGFSRIVSRAISLPKPNPRPANSTVSRAKPTPDPPPLSFLHFFVHPRFTLIHLLLFTILLLRKIVKERTVQSPDYSNHRYYPNFYHIFKTNKLFCSLVYIVSLWSRTIVKEQGDPLVVICRYYRWVESR